MERLDLATYSIYFDGIAGALGSFLAGGSWSQIFILVDENTERDCLPVLMMMVPALSSATVISIPSGEQHKNIATCNTIWEQLSKHRADRYALLLNLGGGVIGDMGGFVAGTYKRGIDFAQLPTSLLAMVDASVGGKTGVDLNAIKNAIGLFNNPQHVFIEPAFLHTLPHRQLVSGVAEMIKHGL